MSLFMDSTLALMPPVEGTPGFERVASAGTEARYSHSLVRDRVYTVLTGATACRVRFGADALALASATSFRVPPNTVMTFRATSDQPNLSLIGDGGALEAWVWPSGR
jgi:hypothetical protein